MSLLWKSAAAFQFTASGWAPVDEEDEMHPADMESRRMRYDLNSHHLNRLKESIQQHGYSPERHGKLGYNYSDAGENVYLHSPGTEKHPDDHEHHEHLLHALKDLNHGPVPVHIHDQSSTNEGHAPVYYHGTLAEDMEEVRPNHGSRGTFGNNGMIHEPGYAYATTKDNAKSYAESASLTHGGRPHVYQVSPLGPVEKDPTYDQHGNHRANYDGDVRSKHGFEVTDHAWSGHDEDEPYYGDEDDEDEGGWD